MVNKVNHEFDEEGPNGPFCQHRGGFGAYELSSEVRRAAEYKLNLFGNRVGDPRKSAEVDNWVGA